MATDPACLSALTQLTTVLDRRRVMSALIGGMALQLLQPLATARVTHDVDLALLVESFAEYEEIRSELLAMGWAPEPEEHRLRSPQGCFVDLLPYPRKDVVDDHVTLPRSKTLLNVAGMNEEQLRIAEGLKVLKTQAARFLARRSSDLKQCVRDSALATGPRVKARKDEYLHFSPPSGCSPLSHFRAAHWLDSQGGGTPQEG